MSRGRRIIASVVGEEGVEAYLNVINALQILSHRTDCLAGQDVMQHFILLNAKIMRAELNWKEPS